MRSSEAVRLAGAGTGEHEQRSGRRLDRVALRAGGALVGECFDRRRDGRRQANRRCERSFALRASSSRLRGGAWISSEAINRRAAAVTSSTAWLNAASFTRDGRVVPLNFRTNCNAEARISSSVAGGSKLARVLMLRHMGTARERRHGEYALSFGRAKRRGCQNPRLPEPAAAEPAAARTRDCQTTRLPDNATARQRDCQQRDCQTTRLPDNATARQRDCQTTRLPDNATARQRGCRTTQTPTPLEAPVLNAFAYPAAGVRSCAVSAIGSCVVWQSRFLAVAISGSRDFWQPRLLAVAPSGSRGFWRSGSALSQRFRRSLQ